MPDNLPAVRQNAMVIASYDDVDRLAKRLAASSFVPATFKGKPDDCFAAILMGHELGLHPVQALQSIAVINGRPSVWGDAMPALCMSHPLWESMEESFNVQTQTATCTVTRKGEEPHTVTFSKADAEKAGLWGKNTWAAYPQRMLQMRARGFALRDKFPDSLKGLVSQEEARDYQIIDVTPARPAEPEQPEAVQTATGISPHPPSASSTVEPPPAPLEPTPAFKEYAQKALADISKNGPVAFARDWVPMRSVIAKKHGEKPRYMALLLDLAQEAMQNLGGDPSEIAL